MNAADGPSRSGDMDAARLPSERELQADDERFMREAIELSKRGQGFVEPNPMVGCVLVRDGKKVGQGFHQSYGGPHAEVEALASCDDPRGSTAYVSLEPCCHQGKTPPCTRALIDAGVERVVISHPDPFEKVDGGGLIELRNAGLQVEVGVLRLESASVLAPYLKRVTRGIPWVIGKWAMTIDGRVATRDGQSQWITGTEAREDVHQVRGRMDAVVTGMGTVRSDDPLLTARPSGVRVANRVVVCRQDLPGDDRQLVATARKVPTILAHPIALSAPAKRLSDRWATRSLPVAWDPQSESKEYLLEILRRLSEMGATNVVLECGPTLMGQFFDHDLIDEFHVYVGASAFGGLHAMGPVGGVGAATMQQARSLHPIHSEPLGCDFKMVYRRDRDTAAPIP